MKIALIGNGNIAPFYLKALEDFNVELLVCSSSSKVRKIGKICFLNDYKNDKILTAHIVIVATPPALHYELLEYFLQRNKNIVVEKPAVISIEQLNNLHKLMTSKLYFAYHTAFNPLIAELDTLLNGKRITKVKVTYEENAYDYHEKDSWVFNKKIAGGGCLIDSGVNIFSVLYKFIPKLTFVKGIAEHRKTEVEDFIKLHMITDTKVPVEISMNWFSQKENRIFLFETDKGNIQINLATNEVSIDNKKLHLFKNIEKIDQKSEYNALVNDFINYFKTSQTHINYFPVEPIKTVLDIYKKVDII